MGSLASVLSVWALGIILALLFFSGAARVNRQGRHAVHRHRAVPRGSYLVRGKPAVRRRALAVIRVEAPRAMR
jgi:hypothetical protein